MSDTRQTRPPAASILGHMVNVFEGLIDRFLLSSAEFERKLRAVRSEQWSWPTPCTEWNVRQLVNHMARGNLNYASLLHGGSAADFLRLRDADALGTDPVGAYTLSVRECAQAFGETGALQRTLDYPLGPVSGQQALAVRITDSTVHTWDLARAVNVDESLDGSLVAWIDEHLDEIYAGLTESPTAVETTHRFFAAPEGVLAHDASPQMRLLHRTGRTPASPVPVTLR
ncbi:MULTISPECIES: TIGR03086 family metal-binding protein [unclassified Streptomyces]|uniref:TIGR03086 family metal-binding protein n=1 Tax=unclassified Streptomyces TaxID=2593676 RepID=UPI00336AD129